MKVSDFDYHLPPELIAQKPLPCRDESRMMVLFRKEEKIIHSRFKEFPYFLRKGDIVVLNVTRVIPAKAWGKKGDKKIEVLFLKEREKGIWEILCRPARKVRVGDTLFFNEHFQAKVLKAEPLGKRVLKFSSPDVLSKLREIGFAPLPPYIKRKKENTRLRSFDLERYQSIFAKREGSIAAPTASLHFTPEILDDLQKKGVKLVEVVLNIGLATFQPVRGEIVEEHKMLEENFSISQEAAQAIEEAKKEARPVLAVGTTVIRALESAFSDGKILPGSRSTSLFIFPGFKFRVVDRLLTNFHLPRSTLLMLVSAFADRAFIMRAYEEAIKKRYRFYSYGDCMLIL